VQLSLLLRYCGVTLCVVTTPVAVDFTEREGVFFILFSFGAATKSTLFRMRLFEKTSLCLRESENIVTLLLPRRCRQKAYIYCYPQSSQRACVDLLFDWFGHLQDWRVQSQCRRLPVWFVQVFYCRSNRDRNRKHAYRSCWRTRIPRSFPMSPV
jgi:hypothetical protein